MGHNDRQYNQTEDTKCIKLITWNVTPQPQRSRIPTIYEMIKLANLKLGHKLYSHKLPIKIETLLKTDKQSDTLKKTYKYNTRHKKLMNQPLVTTKNYYNSFLCETLKQYHQLPKELRDTKSIHTFTKKCKEYLFQTRNPQ